MGRTLHYELRLGKEKLAPAKVMRIVATQVLWNRRFTWSCEQLSLESERVYPLWPHAGLSSLPKDVTTDEGWAIVNALLAAGCSSGALGRARYVLRERNEPGVGMRGFTKVRDDEWNAFLVVRFLEWVSRQVPEATVHATDEGDCILAGSVICRAGIWSLDREKVQEQRAYLESRYLEGYLLALNQACEAAEHGVFFAKERAAPYLDRPEFASVVLSKEEQELALLKEVAEHLRFPGEDAEEQAAA